VPLLQTLNKENKKREFSPRNISPYGNITKSNHEKLIKEELSAVRKEIQLKPKIPTNIRVSETKTKSPIRFSGITASSITIKKAEKKLSPTPRADTKNAKHYRKGSMPSYSPLTTERALKKSEVKGHKTPTLSPKTVPKSARGGKGRKENETNSFVKQEIKEKQSPEREQDDDDLLVQIKIKCYSPLKQDSGKEKSPKSQEDLIKALKMVRKFIDKSIGDDSKLKKLTALLNQPSQQLP